MPKTTYEGPSYEEGREPAGYAPPQPEAPADLTPPPVSAPKADHVDFAVKALDVPPEEAESMTKPDLVELARTGDPEPDPKPAAAPKLTPRPKQS